MQSTQGRERRTEGEVGISLCLLDTSRHVKAKLPHPPMSHMELHSESISEPHESS